jgi:aryl-alcohol dehydrogenase-like predicted oxidoreductase
MDRLELPRFALGCGNFGGVGSAPAFFGRGQDEAQAVAIMDAAWELGVRHFDTADAYGGGRSEAIIGRWMRNRGVRPAITTKTYNPMDTGEDHGLAPERIARQFASSLERLGVDRVDLYLAHEFDPNVPLGETFAAFEALVADGTVDAYGVSNFDAAQLARACDLGAIGAIQNSYSLLDRSDEAAVLPLCAERGVGYIAFGPLAGGWLAGRYRRGEPFPTGSRMTQRPEPYARYMDDRIFDALDVLRAAADARSVSMAGLALAWLLTDARIAQVVVGPSRPAHLEPVREALSIQLAPAERDELDRAFA